MPLADIPDGAPVYSKDGELLGAIKERAAGRFKLDRRFAYDGWLNEADIFVVRDGVIMLSLTADEVQEQVRTRADEADETPE